MSRHRNIRAIDVDEEYDGYYSCYGHSVEDESCISPQTEAQFLYDRDTNGRMGAYLDLNESVPEEDDDENGLEQTIYNLNSIDTAKLQSCVEAMQDVVGDTVPEADLQKAAYEHGFDLEKALNAVLQDKAPKPQRRQPVVSSCNGTSQKTKKDNHVVDTSQKTKNDNHVVDISQKTKNEIHLVDVNEKSQGKSEVSSKKNNGVPGTDFKPNRIIKPENVVPSNDVNTQEVKSESKDEAETENEKSTTKYQKAFHNIEEIYKKERAGEKTHLNLVVVGHVDAGKSTLMGHILFKLGQVSKKTMHKYEQDSKKLGKSSFMYAWVLDETAEERNRGITMDVAQTRFETPSKSVILLDAPGHKDFIPNMITGAAQADAAVLVVDSTRGEFETGFDSGGQTREHTMLIRSLGVSQLVVAVNKMDNVDWSQERFLEIKSKLTLFLRTVGYKENETHFVPCSGLTGENLSTPPESPELKKWYHGPTLIDVIDGFQAPERPIKTPLRMCVFDVFKGITGGFCLAGKVETGFIGTGDKIIVMPAGEQGLVKSILMDDISVQHSFAGESVILQVNGIDINNVATGDVVCDIDNPIKVTTLFEARLVIFNVVIPITRGFPVILHYQSLCEQAVIRDIKTQLNRNTGEVIKRRPRCLSKNTSAIVEIEVNKPICIELFKDFKGLGRFMLRYGGSTIAAGLVTSIK